MEIVIKISDKHYKRIMDAKNSGYGLVEAIQNGTVLPKGHGDLIDRNALITELETDYHNSLSESGAHLFVEITNYIDDAPTIIKTDKENDDEIDN